MKQSEGGHASLCLIHFVCIVMFILGACTDSGVNKASLSSNTNYFFSEKSMIQLPMLDFSQAGPSGSESLKLYNRFYGLEFDNTRQYNGYFEVGVRKIWSEIFIPFRPVGSLFLIHGYFDHLGTLKNLIDESLEKGFAVAVFDLPGHGLSSGNRGAIKSFSDYVEVLCFFLHWSTMPIGIYHPSVIIWQDRSPIQFKGFIVKIHLMNNISHSAVMILF